MFTHHFLLKLTEKPNGGGFLKHQRLNKQKQLIIIGSSFHKPDRLIASTKSSFP